MKRIVAVALISIFTLPVFSQSGKVGKLPTVVQTAFKKDSISIKNFGAKSDGLTLNTSNIQKAINAIHAKGGGVVVIPSGLWVTGPIELKSNVNVHLQRNAMLLFTADKSQYELVETNWEGLPAVRNQSPIYANNATNIAITGFGIIDGNGDAWRMVKKDKLTESQWKRLVASGGITSPDKKTWYPSEQSVKGSQTKNAGVIADGKTANDFSDIKDFLRPNLLVLNKCNKILLEGVTFQNSPAWCLHPLISENIIIRNIFVKNPWYAQNGDGLDLESCKNVLVENSVFDVGDDGICIKSGRDKKGRERNMPTENVVIKNCTVYHAHGGFVIGSEMSGGARNIYVSDCTFLGTDIGLRFKTTRGRGGLVENIFIDNVSMKDIVGEAILFDMYYAAKDPIVLAGEKREPPKVEELPVTEETPRFQNIYIKNIVCDGAEKAIFVRGLPEMNVKNIVMGNMVIQSKQGLDMTEGSGITIKNSNFQTEENNPVLKIHNSKGIVLDNISYNKEAAMLLSISGEKTQKIRLLNTTLPEGSNKVEFNYGAEKNVLEIK